MRQILRAAAAAVLGLCAAQAGAATVDFLGYTHGSQSVTYTLTAPNTPKTGTVGAGGFLTSLNGGPSFETFCVDLYQTINFADPAYNNYTLVLGSAHFWGPNPSPNPNANIDLGRLYAAGHTVNNAQTEAAFQIAVWEIAYETSGAYNTATGDATFSGNATTVALANTWLGALGGGTSGVLVLENREHQDVIFAPVPEPETYALMAAGLMGMGFVARRRQRRAA